MRVSLQSYIRHLRWALVARADMESATPQRQSLQRARRDSSPEGLSASDGAGATRFAMMGDQSLRKAGGGDDSSGSRRSGGNREGGALDLLVRVAVPAGRRRARRAASRSRCARACWRARRRPCCDWCGACTASAQWRSASSASARLDAPGGCPQHRACAVGEQHAQVAVAALGDAPEAAGAARGVFLGRQSEPGGEVARVAKWLTLPLVAATIAVAVSRPTPGIDSSVVQAGRLARQRVSSRSS